MKLLFKQRFFSWFDSYDIYNEAGQTVYTVKGQLSWGHCLKIYDAQDREIGTVKERILTFLPKFEMYLGDRYVGCISIGPQMHDIHTSNERLEIASTLRTWNFLKAVLAAM